MFTPNQDALMKRALDLTYQYGWTKGTMARDGKAQPVLVSDVSAACFCATGFVLRAAYELGSSQTVKNLVLKKIYHVNLDRHCAITTYNDGIAKSIDDIRKILK